MKKKHQHFIPQTYLRKFAHSNKEDKYLVYAYNKLDNKTKSNISVKDICVDTDLYTLNHLPGEEKYRIEDFFNESIESNYPKVYDLLVKKKKKFITGEERTLVLYTTLSMYFRTPKILNQFVNFSSKLIEDLKKDKDIETINFLGNNFSLSDKSIGKLRKEIKEKHRIDYVQTQLLLLNDFVKHKAFDGFAILELVGEQEFITSDNPVIIDNLSSYGFDLFDPGNTIYIPLDNKHALFIAPQQEKAIINQVFYQRDNFFQHVIINHLVFISAERWIIGTMKGIKQFLKDEEQYNKPSDGDEIIVKKFESMVEIMQKLANLIELGISNENTELIKFINQIKTDKIFNETPQFNDIYNQLKGFGLDI
ncbi:DUF4238 domain-containing protein [Psychroserpens sp.]